MVKLFMGFYDINKGKILIDGVDIEEVKSAARGASVHLFIKTLADNYNMLLNEKSDNVSSWQKQLLTNGFYDKLYNSQFDNI